MIALPKTSIDFNDTQTAFEGKSDKELKKMSRLFWLMNKSMLVNIGSKLGLLALEYNLPVESIIKYTIFEHFVGGTTLLNSQANIDKLSKFGVQSILDYGAEGKGTTEDFNTTLRYWIEAVKFAAQNTHVPFISIKITAIATFNLLEKVQEGTVLTKVEEQEYENTKKRLDSICHLAEELGVGVYIDAEESWIQETIDHLANLMMLRYNKNKVTVYNTFQMYRHDRLEFLKNSLARAESEGYTLGAKIVRGAYMEKERVRAKTQNYTSPIQVSKAATDKDYNAAIEFCIKHYEKISTCTATHNMESCRLQVELIERYKLQKNHPHFLFCQLYGMSDNLTFNLQKAGFNTAKYIPYGSIKDVIPYLIRRANENSSVTGEMGRELSLIKKELKRRRV